VSDHAFKIIPHMYGPNPNRPDSSAGEPLIPSLVPLWIGAKFVRQAIHLDGYRCFETIEVQIIGAVFVLLPESEAVRPQLERVPEPQFGWSH